jgi:hypothetical protein
LSESVLGFEPEGLSGHSIPRGTFTGINSWYD